MSLFSSKKHLHIIVASQNPVKINAVKQAFEAVFPNHTLEVEGRNIPSGVSDQPATDFETFTGAQNRCKGAKSITADFWVGIEGGIARQHQQVEAFAWMVLEHSSGKVGQARSASFILPPAVISLLDQGIELGEANDQVFKKIQSKKKGGAVGLLTEGMIDRAGLYKHALILALIPFIQEKLY